MINDLIYVYCISDNPPLPTPEIESKGVISIPLDRFYVIIKYVSEAEFSEENIKKNSSDIQWLDANAREHIMVIGRIMEQVTVIPFNFGTIFQTEERLKKFIEDYSDSLNENFHYVEGKEEWSVKIYCNREKLSYLIDELSTEAADLETQIMASAPGKAFLLRRKKTELIENELDLLCKSIGQKYYDEFNVLSESTHLNNLMPKEYTGRDDTMILNATFFINKTNVSDFNKNAETIRKREGNSCFFIETTGPWPPYSFISIK